jgi:hypothetical protein
MSGLRPQPQNFTRPLTADKTLPVVSFELLGGLRYAYYNQDTRLGLNATLTVLFGCYKDIAPRGWFYLGTVFSV